MVSSPQENRSRKKEPVRVLALQPLTTAWIALSSPWTLTISTLLLAILLVAAAMVPQELGGRELLENFTFSEGRVLEGLEIHTIWTGWATTILAVVGLLSLGAMLLRRLPSFGDVGLRGLNHGSLVSLEERRLSLEAGVVLEHLRALGVKGKVVEGAQEGELKVQSFTMRSQAALLIALGVLICGISLFVDSSGAARFEVDHIPSRPEVEAQTRVLEDGRWVDQKVAFDFRCSAADPANESSRVRTCVFRSNGQTYKFPLHAREVVRAGDHRIQFDREKPIAAREMTDTGGNRTGRIPVRLLLEGDSPKLIAGESGNWLRLEDGRELMLLASADGPVVVVRAKGQEPVLLVPRATLGSQAHKPYEGLSGVPDWTLTTSVSVEPGRLLRYGSWLVLAFGLLLLLLFKHVEVVLRATEDGETLIVVSSNNRPNAPTALLTKLEERVSQ